MRKSVSFAIIAVLILTLSACGNKKETALPSAQSSPSIQSNPSPEPKTVPAPPAVSSGNTSETAAAIAPNTAPMEYDAEVIKAEADAVYSEFYEVVGHLDNDEAFGNDKLYGFYMNFGDTKAQVQAPLFVEFAGGTEEEWYAMNYYERFIWHETYLKFVKHINMGEYNSFFGNDADFYTTSVSALYSSLKTVVGFEEAEAYKALMYWQYEYFKSTSSVYNFITGENYLGLE